MSGHFHDLGIKCAMAVVVVALTTGTSLASSLPGMIKAIPNPPGAPQQNAFIITIPHPHVVPTTAIFDFVSKSKVRTTISEPLTHPDKYQYQAYWKASQQGHVSITVYDAKHQLVAEENYPVTKSTYNPAGRIIVGALFIGASLWFWRRQQRLVRDGR